MQKKGTNEWNAFQIDLAAGNLGPTCYTELERNQI